MALFDLDRNSEKRFQFTSVNEGSNAIKTVIKKRKTGRTGLDAGHAADAVAEALLPWTAAVFIRDALPQTRSALKDEKEGKKKESGAHNLGKKG